MWSHNKVNWKQNWHYRCFIKHPKQNQKQFFLTWYNTRKSHISFSLLEFNLNLLHCLKCLLLVEVEFELLVQILNAKKTNTSSNIHQTCCWLTWSLARSFSVRILLSFCLFLSTWRSFLSVLSGTHRCIPLFIPHDLFSTAGFNAGHLWETRD